MNDIIKLLNLEDPDVTISSVNVQDGFKEITLERKPSPQYCPYCSTRKFNVSDTYVLKIFDRFVNMKRLPLGEILSVDEVHLKIPGECEYALVLFDFVSRQPIDIIHSRRQSVTEPYFAAIPIEERKRVRYLICDMYNPYLSFADKYFPNAQTVVDSFHVVQFLEQQIMNLLISILAPQYFPHQVRLLFDKYNSGKFIIFLFRFIFYNLRKMNLSENNSRVFQVIILYIEPHKIH